MKASSRLSQILIGAALTLLPTGGFAAIGDNAAVNDNSRAMLDEACSPQLQRTVQRFERRLERLQGEVTRGGASDLLRAVRRVNRNTQRFGQLINNSCERGRVQQSFETLRDRIREMRRTFETSNLREDNAVARRFQRVMDTWRELRQQVRAL